MRIVEKKIPFTKVYDDCKREDEKSFDWEEIDSCSGFYTDEDELIEETINEFGL